LAAWRTQGEALKTAALLPKLGAAREAPLRLARPVQVA